MITLALRHTDIIKEALGSIRKRILNATTSKPIGAFRYEMDLFWGLYPLFRGVIRDVRQRVKASGLKPRIKESIQEAPGDGWVNDMMSGAITPDKKRAITAQLLIVSREAVIAAGTKAAFNMAFPFSFNMIRSKVLDKVETKIFKITTTEITDTLAKTIKGKLAAGYQQGWGANKIAKSLTELKTNTRTIARTEINQVVQTAHFQTTLDAADKMNYKMEKTWLTSMDPDVRDLHEGMEGETVEAHMPFSNGLQHPLDPAGSAEEVINCRCDISYRKLSEGVIEFGTVFRRKAA